MPNLEWEVPHRITSPLGTLDLNVVDVVTGLCYVIQPEYKIVPAERVTSDNVSQAPGSQLHDGYPSGLVASLKVEYNVFDPAHVYGGGGADDEPSYEPACQSDLREMHELLTAHLYALWGASSDPNNDQRLQWFPAGSGIDSRMLTGVQVERWPDPEWQNIGWAVGFALKTNLPYAISATEIDTAIIDGDDQIIPNDGSAPFYPVMRVDGPTSAFTITNLTSGLTVVYSGTAIAGGHYVELDFFRGTAYLDGSSSDLSDGIDPTSTDWFTIAPLGGSDVGITGAGMTVLSNNAYC